MEQYFLEFLRMSRAQKLHEFQLALGTSSSQILFALAFLAIYLADNMRDSLPIRQVRMKSCLPRWKIYLSSPDIEGNFVKFTQIFKSFWSGIAIPYDLTGISGSFGEKNWFWIFQKFSKEIAVPFVLFQTFQFLWLNGNPLFYSLFKLC